MAVFLASMKRSKLDLMPFQHVTAPQITDHSVGTYKPWMMINNRYFKNFPVYLLKRIIYNYADKYDKAVLDSMKFKTNY